MTSTTDPRPAYRTALTWAEAKVRGVDPAMLDRPTPCSEYDVRALLGHLVATVDRARVIAEGGDPRALPVVVTEVPDDGWAAVLATAVDKTTAAWSDDAVLDRAATVPWGEVPGRVALWGYIGEALVHGWDLAVATGQHTEADPDVAVADAGRGADDPARGDPGRGRAVRRGGGARIGRGPDRAAGQLGGPPPVAPRGGSNPGAAPAMPFPHRRPDACAGTAMPVRAYRARERYGTIQTWRHPGARAWRRPASGPPSPRWSCSSTWCSCSRSPRSPI